MGMQVIRSFPKHAGHLVTVAGLVEKNYSRSYKIEQLKKVMGIRKGNMHAV